MKLKDILTGTDILSSNCDIEAEISGVECNSKLIKDGAVFVAIRGYATDGNRFIDDARKNGAVVVVTDDKEAKLDIPHILVSDARSALADMSRNFYGRPTDSMKVIGVTGTNGKTTVTYLIKSILERGGAVCGLIGTNQNMISDKICETERTTPESNELWKLFAEMKSAGCTHVIMEVSSHSLVLNRVHSIEYDVGVFTNLTQDHLDFHGTMEEYGAAKAILFRQSRLGIVNYDDEESARIMARGTAKFVTYSASNNSADFVAKNIKYRAGSVEFEIVGIDAIGRIEMNIPGKFSVYNALAAATTCLSLGVPLAEITEALKTVSGVKGRAEVVPTDTDYTVMIDYAHSPDGLENILKTVRDVASGRVIAVFGCGGDRDRAKRPKMGAIASKYADIVIVTSDNPRTEKPLAIIDDILPGIDKPKAEYTVIADRREAIYHALSIARQDDIIVLAGKGHETYQEINHVKHHMDEREIIADYFKTEKR